MIQKNLNAHSGKAMMKVTVLGSGSPLASPQRCSSGYLMEIGHEKIMMECGPGTVHRLVEAGHKPIDIDKVFLSHLHFDHWLDLLRLVLCRWDATGANHTPLEVWGPPGTKDIVDKAFSKDGLLKLDLTARTNHEQSVRGAYYGRGGTGERPWPEVEVMEIGDGDVVTGENWKVTFSAVPHHQPYLESFGMRWEAFDKVIGYSSDISHNPEECVPPGLAKIARNADILIQYMNVHGADHNGQARNAHKKELHTYLAEVARDCDVKTMIVTHLGPFMNRPSVRERITAELCSVFPGQFIWGEDHLAISAFGDT